LENISAEEITDIVILPKMKSIFLVGWSRKILAYHNFKITKEEVMKPDLNWLKFDHHQDDILACSFYPSNILATSTYDGEVYIWLVDRGRLKGKLKRRSVTGDEAKEHRLSLMRSVAGHLTRRQESREQTVRIVTPFETEEGRQSSVRQDERSASRASSPQRMPSRRARQLAKPHQSAYSNQMRAIELMVFLTAREHEHGAVLVASNGTQVEFWSLYGNGRLVAKFLGQLPADGLLTALATNNSNDFLITGDNSGNVVFWQIGQYGLFETLAEVTNELVHKERKKSTISTVNTKPPPIHLTLNCHPDYAITGLVYIDSIGVLVTSSTDFSVKLWTSSGEPIGMFGQRQKWNLRRLGKAAEQTEEKSQQEEDEVGSEADSMDVPEEAEAQEETVHEKLEESTGNKLPAINTTKVKEKPSQIVQDMKRAKASPVYILRSEVVDAIDKKKLEWSLLGEKYNSEFERRMQNREKRRTKVGQVEEMSYLGYGGLTNVCAPFKALHTSDPIEFRLPEGLPVTSKAVPAKKEVDPFPLNI
jgi:WD40 repeat protein